MSSVSSTLFLRKEPFSFLDGVVSVFDYAPFSASYDVSPTPQIADAKAISSDFIVTGDDIRTALRLRQRR